MYLYLNTLKVQNYFIYNTLLLVINGTLQRRYGYYTQKFNLNQKVFIFLNCTYNIKNNLFSDILCTIINLGSEYCTNYKIKILFIYYRFLASLFTNVSITSVKSKLYAIRCRNKFRFITN